MPDDKAQASGAHGPGKVDPGASQPGADKAQAAAAEQPPQTDADWKRFRLKAEKREKELLAELEKLKAEKLTETEKQIAQARAEGRAEIEKLLIQERLDGAIRRTLVAKGVPEDQAYVVRAKYDQIDSVDEAIEAAGKYADGFLAEIRQGKPAIQQGAPSGQTKPEPWSSSRVRKLSRQEFLQYGAEIQKAREDGTFIYD